MSLFRKFDVVQSTDGKSMYLDFDLETYLARLTLWDQGQGAGACDMEILNVETEETIYWKHEDFHDSTQFTAVLTAFSDKLHALVSLPETSGGEAGSNDHAFALFLEDKKIGLNGVLEPLLMAKN